MKKFGKQGLFKKHASASEDVPLQITSLADIFVILLVFLLKSFSTGSASIMPSAGVQLAQASSDEVNIEALKVEITETGVNVEGQPVVTLTGFKFPSQDLQANGTSGSLSKSFERERQRQLLIAKSNSDVKVDPKIIVVSDQRAPYGTVKSVLASAALNGYTDFKLAVVRKE